MTTLNICYGSSFSTILQVMSEAYKMKGIVRAEAGEDRDEQL
jgi:hypothetical protein